MCFVIIRQHNSLFLGEKFLLFKPHFRTVVSHETYVTYSPPKGEPRNEQGISGMCTHFRVVMET